jgi:hypothetical protein
MYQNELFSTLEELVSSIIDEVKFRLSDEKLDQVIDFEQINAREFTLNSVRVKFDDQLAIIESQHTLLVNNHNVSCIEDFIEIFARTSVILADLEREINMLDNTQFIN